MVISKTMQDAINKQINKEFYSEYLYLDMAIYFFNNNLNGFGAFFLKQAEEEREHAMKFFKYLYDRRGEVELNKIEKPNIKFTSAEQVFEEALKHEEFVTASIYGLVETAKKENDYATLSLLNWFTDEQVEEEGSMDSILQKLKAAKGHPGALMMLNSQVANRG